MMKCEGIKGIGPGVFKNVAQEILWSALHSLLMTYFTETEVQIEELLKCGDA
jgi:hypothetical protein